MMQIESKYQREVGRDTVHMGQNSKILKALHLFLRFSLNICPKRYRTLLKFIEQCVIILKDYFWECAK